MAERDYDCTHRLRKGSGTDFMNLYTLHQRMPYGCNVGMLARS